MKNFVGFGLGAIQVGLFLWEGLKSNKFSRFTVIEVDESTVNAVKKAGGNLKFHIAAPDHIHSEEIPSVEILHPQTDRDMMIRRLQEADEIATAIPSVDFYNSGGEQSIVSLLSKALDTQKQRLIFTAENNNHAAEILRDEVKKKSVSLSSTQFVNTVIGKMSGPLNPDQMEKMSLSSLVPGFNRGFLVEEFNRIQMEKVGLEGFKTGFEKFEQKEDLLPFEEAKLYGHNCIHAWLAYSCWSRGISSLTEAVEDNQLMVNAKKAFIEEAGAGLMHKHRGTNDPLFTEKGFAYYADDLLKRMVNPFLSDTPQRVGRDPKRKLMPRDRLCGSAQLAIQAGIQPYLLLDGIIAGLDFYAWEQNMAEESLPGLLKKIWEREPENQVEKKLFSMLEKHSSQSEKNS